MRAKFFIGPMSKNIVDSVIEFANNNNIEIGLIPSRRQVELKGGYVNNWTTKDFCEYVRSKTNNVLLVRDHSGPNQGTIEDDGVESFTEDCKYFDIIHVDVWKKYESYTEGLNETIKFINLGYKINHKLLYEVGTEEAIRKFEDFELNNLLTDLKEKLNDDVFSKIKYAVIQSGTALNGNKNIGLYNSDKLCSMINICNKHGMISKEHNGDYLKNELLNEKFNLGLDCINIAPEFGQIETNVILDRIFELKRDDLFNKFYKICFESKKWIKWVSSNFIPENNKEELINICGHYVFSNSEFLTLKKELGLDIDKKIKQKIYNRIQEIDELSSVDLEIKLNTYFDLFSNKDINGLSKLFSEDVKLVDWNISKSGKLEVIEANKKIFNSVDTIKVTPNKFYKNNNSYAVDISILVNEIENLDVIDIISFNKEGKINSIKAYKK
jgi:hypothetical protein